MSKKNTLLSVLVVSGLLPACQPKAHDLDTLPPVEENMHIQVTGQAAYRERIMLAPDSTFNVRVLDISRADSRSPVIAEYSRLLTGEQVPLAFKLNVPKVKMQRNARYAVRATITGPDKRLSWTTDTVYLVNPAQMSQDIGTLQLVNAKSSHGPNDKLTGKILVVEDVSGKGIIDNSNITINFGNDGRVTGSDGCNQYSADYQIEGQALKIGAIAGTKRACAPALMNQGNSFMRVLQDVNSWSTDRYGRLTLKTRNGRYLLTTAAR